MRVRAPGIQGSFEVLHNHAPMIAAIEIGPLYITNTENQKIAFATSGGFVEVLNNTVTILAETAEPASDIDIERAKAAEEKALALLESDDADQRERARRKLERARLRMSMGKVGTASQKSRTARPLD